MKANPGGQIELGAVVGRDDLIRNLWETIEQQSVMITAERRIGKTTIMKKMRAEPPAGWVPVYMDLERCHSAADFAELIYAEVDQFLGKKSRAARRVKEWATVLSGTEVKGVKLPTLAKAQWKDVLTHSIEDLVFENEASDTRLLFLWDEVPYMLASISQREGEATAMAVLDLLRSLRQTHAGLRMVITGSIGLHHVLTALKDKNYANAPINDLAQIDVPPLRETDAAELAVQLIAGEKLESPHRPEAAAAVARQSDCFPYYIHHIVKSLKLRGLAATPAAVEEVVAAQLVDANDPWQLLHYRERLTTYYGADAPTVCLILDELAVKDAAAVDELLKMLKGASAFSDRERLLRLLSLMERDHYLKRGAAGRYGFRFPLLRRWWKLHRSL